MELPTVSQLCLCIAHHSFKFLEVVWSFTIFSIDEVTGVITMETSLN